MRLRQLLIIATILFLICACVHNSDRVENKNSSRKHAEKIALLHKIDTTSNIKLLNEIIKSYQDKISDTVLLQAIWKKSSLFNEMNKQDSVLKYDRLLLQVANNFKNLNYKAKAESYLAYDYREKQLFDSSFYYYQKAKNSYSLIKDSTQIGRKLLEMGKIQYRKNDFYGSKESITEALSFFDKIQDKKYIIWSLNELGNNYAALKDYENAASSYKRAIKMEKDFTNRILYQNNLAVLYAESNNYDNAIEILKKIIVLIPPNFKEEEYARLIHNLAEYKWKLEKTDIIKEYLRALSIRKKSGDKRGLLSSYNSLAEYFMNSNKKKSSKYADTLIRLSKKLGIPKAETDALQILMQIDPNNIRHKNRYIFLKDSLYQQELKVKTQFAKLRYDDQQEKQQLLALEAETAKQETQLAQQKTQKVIFLSLSTLLFMGGSFLYFVLRQRHKKEKLKEVYNTEKRISQELHDGLANNIFGLITKIQSKKNTPQEVLDSLDTIYTTTREISHKNSAIKTGHLFKEELLDLIETYQDQKTSILTKGIHTINWQHLKEQKCIVLHRSLKELLVNLKKHAKATLVSIQFQEVRNGIKVTYNDNGIGLKSATNKGIGLTHMQSRIQNLDGEFKIYTNKTRGTKIEIILP
ncbi:hypothetical protein [uncultured Croceitalea sp.]|uniref:ATP-binding protein n=1 Tax=uncultured Croceitalea sp. TaxID=1798908 RepID=UPI0033068F02